ncbi:MAG: bifunctional folylpolyglutamate synthase/dihydrofolate synthase [Bacteroidota bacterium]|nr:bifunctional folylpolyglutamate synthase/dihydrofolate synthase [Bacteroidota bacterium]
MTYEDTLAYLFEQLPMFHRIGPAAYKANLDNTYAIMKLLDHPEKDFRCVHIAGTNGKGSTSHMLASILQQSGYKTGLYTSPHLRDFRERIRVNGKMIEKPEVVKFVKKYKKDFEKIEPSFFEWTVGLAFDYFSRKNVDIAIIETGLGGRLDSTNVVTPLVSVITNVQWDHMSLLGNTLEKIAKEKAGIIKPGIPVVIGTSDKRTLPIFKKTSQNCKAPLFFADKIFKATLVDEEPSSGSQYLNISLNKASYIRDLKLDLGGWYQLKNIPTVLQIAELLQEKGFELNRKNIRKGLGAVKKNTGLAGRWQVLAKVPLVIADTAHNVDGLSEVMEQLNRIPYTKLHLVIGMVNDKEISGILKLFPKKAICYFCKPDIPRGLDTEILRKEAASLGLKGKIYASVTKALEHARDEAGKNDLIFVGGSTFVVAEVV